MSQKKKSVIEEIFASCSFSSLGLHQTLCDQLQDRMGFKAPTLIQAQAIPVALSGRHVLVNAATGTGKTIAYLAPVIHHLQMYEPRVERSDGTFGVSILVATPGRLLDHLKNTASFLHTNLRWVIFDEADRILELGFGKEIEEILEFLGTRQCETDAKGNGVLRHSQSQRQNLLLSATLNEKVNHLARISLENPVMIGLDEKMGLIKKTTENLGSIECDSYGESELSGTPSSCLDADYNLPAQLVQRFVKVPCGSRLVVLLSVLLNIYEMEASTKVVVFFSTCDAVNFHYELISKFHWGPELGEQKKYSFAKCKVFRLHGNMEHEDRRTTFQGFKSEKSALLLCTDVAARGLDFPEVRRIIQYDSPGEASEYVHRKVLDGAMGKQFFLPPFPGIAIPRIMLPLGPRVGRTARLGKKGDALLFLQPVEMDYLQDLTKHGVVLEEFSLLKVLDKFLMHNQNNQRGKFISLEMHPWVLSLQRALESYITAEAKLKKLAKDAFCSWVRAYTAHRGELKRIFMVKKLHLGHVARSFGLKELPSLVGGLFQKQMKKRKREQKQEGLSKRRKVKGKR